MILLLPQAPGEVALPHIHEPGRAIRTSLGDEIEAQLDAALAAADATPREWRELLY